MSLTSYPGQPGLPWPPSWPCTPTSIFIPDGITEWVTTHCGVKLAFGLYVIGTKIFIIKFGGCSLSIVSLGTIRTTSRLAYLHPWFSLDVTYSGILHTESTAGT